MWLPVCSEAGPQFCALLQQQKLLESLSSVNMHYCSAYLNKQCNFVMWGIFQGALF